MEVLPDNIVELLESYDVNCMLVEGKALMEIASINIPMFGALRDLKSSSVYSILHRLEKWFGKERNMEYCLCLVMLTDYVSCAYNSTSIYKTFHGALTERYVDGIFEKLCFEWQLMFLSKSFSELPCSKIHIVRRLLTTTGKRYSNEFRHRNELLHLASLKPHYIGTSTKAKHSLISNRDPMLSLKNNDCSSYKIEQNDRIVVVKIPKVDISQFNICLNTSAEKNAYRKQNGIIEQPVVKKRKAVDSEIVASKIPKLDANREITNKLLTQQKLHRPWVDNSMIKQTGISKSFDVRQFGLAELETSKFEANCVVEKMKFMQENQFVPRPIVDNSMRKPTEILGPHRMQNTIITETIIIDDDIPDQNWNSFKKVKPNAFDILMRRAGPFIKKNIRL